MRGSHQGGHAGGSVPWSVLRYTPALNSSVSVMSGFLTILLIWLSDGSWFGPSTQDCCLRELEQVSQWSFPSHSLILMAYSNALNTLMFTQTNKRSIHWCAESPLYASERLRAEGLLEAEHFWIRGAGKGVALSGAPVTRDQRRRKKTCSSLGS